MTEVCLFGSPQLQQIIVTMNEQWMGNHIARNTEQPDITVNVAVLNTFPFPNKDDQLLFSARENGTMPSNGSQDRMQHSS